MAVATSSATDPAAVEPEPPAWQLMVSKPVMALAQRLPLAARYHVLLYEILYGRRARRTRTDGPGGHGSLVWATNQSPDKALLVRRAIERFRTVLPESVSPERVARHSASEGASRLALCLAMAIEREQPRPSRFLTMQGIDEMAQMVREGPVFVGTSHSGSFWALLPLLQTLGRSLFAFGYLPYQQPHASDSKTSYHFAAGGAVSLLACLRAVRSGENIWGPIDHGLDTAPRHGRDEIVPFLGRPVRAARTTALVCGREKVPCVFARIHRVDAAAGGLLHRFEGAFEVLWRPGDAEPASAIPRLLLEAAEREVLTRPDQYCGWPHLARQLWGLSNTELLQDQTQRRTNRPATD